MPAVDGSDLRGLRVLVVEDVLLIADMIVQELQDQGCSVVGPAPRLEQGLALATSEALDGALLDVNLAGERCFPIADVLAQRRIPFAFMTGYGEVGIPSEYRCVPRVSKPFRAQEVLELVAKRFKPSASQ
jgi:CheY-like chemotaxis protein